MISHTKHFLKIFYSKIAPILLYGSEVWRFHDFNAVAQKVKCLLFSCGYGYAWESQFVNNHRTFVASVRQTLKDIYQQKWQSILEI